VQSARVDAAAQPKPAFAEDDDGRNQQDRSLEIIQRPSGCDEEEASASLASICAARPSLSARQASIARGPAATRDNRAAV
jgi:hypothetical protein